MWLCTDFNCTVQQVDYVNDILDRLLTDHPRIYQMILYVDSPLLTNYLKTPPCTQHLRAQPLFMDESAHDCASYAWGGNSAGPASHSNLQNPNRRPALPLLGARTRHDPHGTGPHKSHARANPHALLTAYAGTVMGFETNAMQFYPDASLPKPPYTPASIAGKTAT